MRPNCTLISTSKNDLGTNKITTSVTSLSSNVLIPKSYADAFIASNTIADDSITDIKIHDLLGSTYYLTCDTAVSASNQLIPKTYADSISLN